jgi:hypothetical protein
MRQQGLARTLTRLNNANRIRRSAICTIQAKIDTKSKRPPRPKWLRGLANQHSPTRGTSFAMLLPVRDLPRIGRIGMNRIVWTLAVWLGCVSVSAASLTPRTETSTFGENDVPLRLASKICAQAVEQVARSPYVLNERTEVLLDGKPCKYENVPANASILRMETAADQKTVLKIYFRSRK